MHDDLDAQLLRRFASAAHPLEDAGFSARLAEQLHRRHRLAFSSGTLHAVLGALFSALGTALVLPWRQRHARLLLAGAAAMSVWTVFL